MRTLKFKTHFHNIAFFAAVNHNYDHKQRTLKQRNTQNGSKSTNHKSQTMTFWTCEVKLSFLRGLLRWLTAAKNAIVAWLLNFRIRTFVKRAVNRRSQFAVYATWKHTLRGPLRWLTAAKNAIIGWLLNFRICMFVKSAILICGPWVYKKTHYFFHKMKNIQF